MADGTLQPDGFTCECGKRHPFDAYVYAHWDVLLVHTCACGRQHDVLRGQAQLHVTDDDD